MYAAWPTQGRAGVNIGTRFRTRVLFQFEIRITVTAYEKHFPNKRVKVNKYKHKLSSWITSGLIKSIEFRDKLYKRLKTCPQDNPEHNRMENNLKTYNGYLKQCIRFAKRQHYVHEFTKYKNDIRKTWDTLKDIMNTKKSKSDSLFY